MMGRMCAERSSAELAGEVVKCQVPSAETGCLAGALAVANLTACRVTEVLEHQASNGTSRNAKPEMVSVNGIELRQGTSVVAQLL